MSMIDTLKRIFGQAGGVLRLIYLNVAFFVVINLLQVLFVLFVHPEWSLMPYLGISADLHVLAFRIWTLFTYMFQHQDIFHILFNMLNLFWFGKIFSMYYSDKQLLGLYVIGGLVGALFFVASYNLIPLFGPMVAGSLLIGASASVMAIVLASAFRVPNMELQMLFIGRVKLKYIAAFFVIASVLSVAGQNAGGQFAHLGGSLAGYIFVVSLRKGMDITTPVTWVLDTITNLFKPRKLKIKKNPHFDARMSDGDYNASKARRMEDIDRILDKIKKSGYDSLSDAEKRKLFDQGNHR